MSTKVIKEGNVTTTIMDLTNGVGDKSAEVRVHGVLTFRTQVMSPPHPKINCSLILRHPRARIRWNLKDSSREMGLFKKTRSK